MEEHQGHGSEQLLTGVHKSSKMGKINLRCSHPTICSNHYCYLASKRHRKFEAEGRDRESSSIALSPLQLSVVAHEALSYVLHEGWLAGMHGFGGAGGAMRRLSNVKSALGELSVIMPSVELW